MTVAIVGAGRVGRNLGRSLHRLGWRVGVVVTRSRRTARAAVRAIGAGRAQDRLVSQVRDADLVLIATPDSAIRHVAARLARVAREVRGEKPWRGKVVLHTSGALDRSVLAPLARGGAATGSLHPLQTFGSRGQPQLRGIFFAIEGDRRARLVARRIARSLGGIPVEIDGQQKPAYHAAGAFAANYVLAIVETATRILMAVGFSRSEATRALLPLARQTLENYERFGPRPAWTGPLSRGDYATVGRHVAALRKLPAEYRRAYAALTRLAARVVATNPQSTLRRLEQFLRGT